MTEETTVIHALRWWWRLRRLAESRPDPGIARRSASAAVRPARCAADLAAIAQRLLAGWNSSGTAAVQADLEIHSVALLTFSGQLAAECRDQGGGTAWAGWATAAADYARAALDIDLPPGRDLAGTLTAPASGLWELRDWLVEREPVVIAARPAAEIAAGRTAYLVALRQTSHAITEAMFTRRRLRRSP
jgi:hypothetical protein